MPPAGLEPTAPGLGILCSIHLSYGGAATPLETGIFVIFLCICYHLLQSWVKSQNAELFSPNHATIIELLCRAGRIGHCRLHFLAKPVCQHAQSKDECHSQLFSARSSGTRRRGALQCGRSLCPTAGGARIRQSRHPSRPRKAADPIKPSPGGNETLIVIVFRARQVRWS